MGGTDWVALGGIAQLIAAGATIILAGVTATMARRTHSLANEAQDQVTATREATDAANRTAQAAERDVQQGLRLIEIGQGQVEAIQAQASANLEQVEVAREALLAGFRPLLVPVTERPVSMRRIQCFDGVVGIYELGPEPRCWIDRDQTGRERFWAVVPLWNIGPGPAVLSSNPVDASFVPYFSGARRLLGRPSSRVVAPHDIVDVAFYGDADDYLRSILRSEPGTGRQGTFDIRYFDVAETYASRTRLFLGRGPHPFLTVDHLEFEAREGTPNVD